MAPGASSTHERLLSNMAMLFLIFRDTPKVFCVLPGPYHMCKPAQSAHVLLSCMSSTVLKNAAQLFLRWKDAPVRIIGQSVNHPLLMHAHQHPLFCRQCSALQTAVYRIPLPKGTVKELTAHHG